MEEQNNYLTAEGIEVSLLSLQKRKDEQVATLKKLQKVYYLSIILLILGPFLVATLFFIAPQSNNLFASKPIYWSVFSIYIVMPISFMFLYFRTFC